MGGTLSSVACARKYILDRCTEPFKSYRSRAMRAKWCRGAGSALECLFPLRARLDVLAYPGPGSVNCLVRLARTLGDLLELLRQGEASSDRHIATTLRGVNQLHD